MNNLTSLKLFTPLGINAEPIRIILQECSCGRSGSISKWSDAKLQELKYVGILGGLMASLQCSAFTWPLASNTVWIVTALWYSGLVFIIASVSTATQQAITLSRLACLPDYDLRIRDMLGYRKKPGTIEDALPHHRPRTVYLPRFGINFIVQIPVMMLRFGIYFFLFGLGVLIGYDAWERGNVFSSETKTATMFAVVTTFAICCHAISVFSSYSRWVPRDPREPENINGKLSVYGTV